ncbi:MAG TPA: undecaprenyldiphospho-muramoylpentapeptide beta-N-acetylglucosaminyltransferase [Candidatus Omnitrophota bacterium]|nr:undecaprenyldiphospho-muramoylpentapeptide beta-N-acetylglucosaminyltransferase [Candidatus Omnitrophota bacterium]HPS20020.1 undecaprenyldiphospho-muramoylpentapeptide beta-N-acetylglucosaminyltransferase [Candidatus Omnitrophota bacterium]
MKVILASGGSGGHIFPSVALAGALEKQGVEEIYFVSSKRRLDKSILGKTKYKCFFLSINPMPFSKNPLKWLVFLIKFVWDTLRSFLILVRIRPVAVVGFGGYSSGPITRCAAMLHIPVAIHEQNFVPGRANIILAKVADLIAVSFSDDEKHFSGCKGKVVFTGNPIRNNMLIDNKEEAARFLGLDPAKPTVLIMGGSQGATFLNNTAQAAAGIISAKLHDNVQFVHLTGNANFDAVNRAYLDGKLNAKAIAFLDKMEMAYSAADVAISRSGAAAIFELAFYGIPMILVPYPNPKNSQRNNAMYFSNHGAAIYREESDLSAESLADEAVKILTDIDVWKKMSKASLSLARPEAADVLASEVIKLGRNGR